VHNKKHYYWSEKDLRERTFIFFTEQVASPVTAEFYVRNEEAFFKLIHNTYDESKHSESSNMA